jgi:hypothetical protein
MNWYKIVKSQSVITEIPYGYWILPNGDEYEVGDVYGHDNMAEQIDNKDTLSALNAGWLRMVTDVKKQGREQSKRQGLNCSCQVFYRSTLNQIIKARKLFENALCGDTIYYDSRTKMEVVKISQLMSIIQSEPEVKVKPKNTQSVETLNDPQKSSIPAQNIQNMQNQIPLDKNLARQQARAKNNPLMRGRK